MPIKKDNRILKNKKIKTLRNKNSTEASGMKWFGKITGQEKGK